MPSVCHAPIHTCTYIYTTFSQLIHILQVNNNIHTYKTGVQPAAVTTTTTNSSDKSPFPLLTTPVLLKAAADKLCGIECCNDYRNMLRFYCSYSFVILLYVTKTSICIGRNRVGQGPVLVSLGLSAEGRQLEALLCGFLCILFSGGRAQIGQR